MRRTISTLTALVAAAGLAACSTDEGTTSTTTRTTTSSQATTEDGAATSDAAGATSGSDAGAATSAADDTATTSGAVAAPMSDPVCADFFQGQGQPMAERAGTTRDLLKTGDDLDPVSYSELSLLQSRIVMLSEDASAEQAALLERVNAPLTEVVDAVVKADSRLEEKISVPKVDVADSEAAQSELEAACAG